MRKFGTLLTAALILGLILLPGCSSGGSSPEDGADTSLTFAQQSDVFSLDPTNQRDTESFIVIDHIYDTLVTFNQDLEIVPRLAEDWRQIGELTWEFDLRDDVTFHDGTPLTAEAVVFSLMRNLDTTLQFPVHSTMRPILKGEAVDDHTVRIITKEPSPTLLAALTLRPYVMPPHYIEEYGWEHLHNHPMGSGPYQFVEWVPGERVVLRANPDYFDGRPAIDEVIFRPIPESATRVAELITGGIDAMRQVPPDAIPQLEESGIRVIVSSETMLLSLHFRDVGPFQDKRVRQALNYAVDRNELVEFTIGAGLAEPTGLYHTIREYPQDETIAPFSYNPEKARALLEEAGYPDRFEFSLAFPTTGYTKISDVAQAIAGQLDRIGITANLVPKERGIHEEQVRDKTVPEDAYLQGGANPFTFSLRRMVDTLHSDYSNYFGTPELDELTEEGLVTTDPEKQKEMLHTLLSTAMDIAPSVPLYTQLEVSAARPEVNWHGPEDFQPKLYKASLETQDTN